MHTITLTQEQLQIVMAGLGGLPWRDANPVIIAIVQQQQQQQAQAAQIEPSPATPAQA